MLRGKTKFLKYTMKVKGRDYEKYLINFPTEVARDSQFPFQPGDELVVEVVPDKGIVILKKSV